MAARKDLLLDGAIATLALAVALLLLGLGEGGDPFAVLFTALSALPLVARRRAVVAVFLFTTLASSAVHLLAEPVGPPIAPTLALYWMAEGADESQRRTRLAVALTGFLVHLVTSGLGRDAFPGAELLFGSLLWSGVWLAGERTRLRQERMAELEERALRAEREAERERRLAAAEERTRIARDLHDSAGHAINVILVHAGLGRLKAESDPEGARQAFETIEEVARETVDEIDQMVAVLREHATVADDSVEPPAGVAALDALVARHRAAGLEVNATVSGDRRPLPPGVDQGAYRILQEALTNAARHGAGDVRVELRFEPGALAVSVTNALRAGGATRNGGHGLVGMRERAALLGGTLAARAVEGRFEVRAQLPTTGRAA